MSDLGIYRKLNSCSPGGWKCRCCAPQTPKLKKQSKRIARKKLNIFTAIIENQE